MVDAITPWIELEDHTKIPLILTKSEGNTYCYAGDNGQAELKLVIREKRNIKAVFVEARLCTEKSKPGSGHLNPESAVVLGIHSIGDIKGYMADFLYSQWWCDPYLGSDLKDIPNDTQALLWEKKDGTFGYMLAVCDEKYKCAFNGNETGFEVKLFSWFSGLSECSTLAFLLAEGENPFMMAEQCAEYGLELLDTGYRIRKERRYPEIFEYLGWCSWDALQIRVSTGGLLEKCEEFRQKDIPVRWAIIDDMWAEVKGLNDIPEDASFDDMVGVMHDSRIYSFEADPIRFPGGLKECIRQMKAQYGLRIGVWHPASGYWKGIDPDGPIAKEYKDALIEVGDGRLVVSPQLDKAYTFYNAFHTYLKRSGADFVKIDDQSCVKSFWKGKMPVGQAARNLHKALESSVGANFDNQLLNCAGMSVENMWNRPASVIARCSNDFLPENREWFIKHILQCSYNSFVHGNFVCCDWDMWWSDDGQAVKNSVLRAVSGGPVYLSDKIGRSIKDVIMPLVLGDGRILRCDQPAVPTKDCLIVDAQNAGTPFKVWNKCGDSGVVAAFNLNGDNRPVDGSLSVLDVDGLEGERFAVYEHFSRRVKIIGRDGKIEIHLNDRDDFRLFVVVPFKDGLAPIGLINKYISPKTVMNATASVIELFEGGEVAFVCDKAVEAVVVNDQKTQFAKNENLYIVDCSCEKDRVSIQLIH